MQPQNCLLVHPKFVFKSFWNYQATCELMGAKYPAAPLGLMTVAALLPSHWNIRLIDCNVEELRDEDLLWANVVMSGGMIAQQQEHLKLIERVRRFALPHIVGGPDPTSSPQLYAAATHLVLDEAEVTLPGFIEHYLKGTARHVYQANGVRAEMSSSPVPRFDLIEFKNYLHVGIQSSRGCPFSCEFCDIIELFGRKPRFKEPTQIVAELQRLYDLGYRGHIDIVDDNLIGNKKSAKALLEKMYLWLAANRWPFEFSCEASINLSQDDEMLSLMQKVGFCFAFVGIETPDKETLMSTGKRHNTRNPIAESIHKINRHGIIVNAGYIVGFDGEQGPVSQKIIDCIEQTAIPANMVGLLYALPGTQLTRRLKSEGRLHDPSGAAPDGAGDQCVTGLNFRTLRPKAEILGDFRDIIRETYAPQQYFGRVERLATMMDCSQKKLKIPLSRQIKDLRAFGRLVMAMGIKAKYRKHFWKVLLLVGLKNARATRYAVSMMALYLHFGIHKDYMIRSSSA